MVCKICCPFILEILAEKSVLLLDWEMRKEVDNFKKLFNFILIQLDDVKCEQWFAALSAKDSKNKNFSFHLSVRNGVALTKRSRL